MNILVISDFHMCNGNPFSTFGWRDEDFISRLELYRRIYGIDMVVLNGDIFEMYKYSFKRIYKNHRRLIDYCIGNRFILIRGNHDSTFAESINEITLVNSAGKKIHLEHGHKADFCGYLAVRILHRVGFRALKLLALLGSFHAFLRFVVSRNEDFDGVKVGKERYRRYARSLTEEMYDVVILGHTHTMEVETCSDGVRDTLYLNSGTCSHGRFQGVVLDTETLEYFFIKDAVNRKNTQPASIRNDRLLEPVV